MAPLRLLALGLFVLPLACSSEDDRPPPASSCTGGGCITYGPPSQTGGNRGPADGDAAVPVLDAGPSAAVSGAVRVYQTEQLTTAADFVGDGVVGAEAPVGRVTAEFSGAAYTLDGVLADAAIWADLEATDTVLDVMPTLQRIDATMPDASLYFVPLATMEDIAAALLSPIELSPERGHAVLTFVDGNGAGVPGVTVTSHTGQAVAYDTGGGIFRDDQEGTTTVGRAVVLNAQALGFPGGTTSLGFSAASAGSTTVKLAAGAVTLLTVVVD